MAAGRERFSLGADAAPEPGVRPVSCSGLGLVSTRWSDRCRCPRRLRRLRRPRMHLPDGVPAKLPRTEPVALSTAARSCGCAAPPTVRATGPGTCVVRQTRGPVARLDPAPSSAASLDLPEDCGDRSPPCLQNNRKPTRFQAKTKVNRNVL